MLKDKRLLILGANAETAVLVNSARKMGVFTIVTDNVPNADAKKVADKSYDIDGMDVDALEKMALHENVDGVLVGTADPLIRPYFELCTRLGMPCYANEESVDVFTNKKHLKEKCKLFGIEGIPEYSYEEVMLDQNVVYPILIKPADGRSGKGMSVCYSKEEVNKAVDKALQFSIKKEYIIERYMQCDDVFVYYTFQNGKYYLSAMADRYTCKEQIGCDPVVLGGIYPSKYLNWYMQEIHPKMCQMFSDLQIQNGVLLIQAFVEDGHFYVYDPGFRLQGGAPHILINDVNGFDHREMLIEYALTGKMGTEDVGTKNDPLFHGKICASQTILLKKGMIARIEGLDAVRKYNEVILTTQRLHVNDEVHMIGTEQQILVRFHLVCNDFKHLKQIVDKINEEIKVYDTEGNNMKLGGLEVII